MVAGGYCWREQGGKTPAARILRSVTRAAAARAGGRPARISDVPDLRFVRLWRPELAADPPQGER